jgi:hypothetical protein
VKRILQNVCGNRLPGVVGFCLVWVLLFMILLPVLWTAGFAIVEWQLVGNEGLSYPRTAAFVTLVTGPKYVRGARVLGVSLRMQNVRSYPLIAMEVGLSEEEKGQLRDVGWEVRSVEPIPFFPPNRNKSLWKWVPEARLGPVHVHALTKMRVWEMEEFERVIFIDSDAWVIRDVCAHLCRRQEGDFVFLTKKIILSLLFFPCVQDLIGMNAENVDVNSGVLSLRPSWKVFVEMMDFWTHSPHKFFVYHNKNKY